MYLTTKNQEASKYHLQNNGKSYCQSLWAGEAAVTVWLTFCHPKALSSLNVVPTASPYEETSSKLTGSDSFGELFFKKLGDRHRTIKNHCSSSQSVRKELNIPAKQPTIQQRVLFLSLEEAAIEGQLLFFVALEQLTNDFVTDTFASRNAEYGKLSSPEQKCKEKWASDVINAYQLHSSAGNSERVGKIYITRCVILDK